jgi:hypothetical protein
MKTPCPCNPKPDHQLCAICPSRPTVSDFYDTLPLTEKTLIKCFRNLPYRIANDRGQSCAWFIYDIDNDNPVAVVTYYKGSKLVMHSITPR